MGSASHLKENNGNNSAKVHRRNKIENVGIKSSTFVNESSAVLFTEHHKYRDLSEEYRLNSLCWP